MRKITSKSTVWLGVVIVLWALVLWFYARPPFAAADWHGWRQADTQAIALNFRDSGNDILHPQIDWRGAGPGFVETEFQIYTYLFMPLLPTTGNAEWPGQLLSLLAIALAVVAIYHVLARVFAPVYGLLGAIAALANLGSVHLATAIQPDALCFLFYCLQFVFFFRFLEQGESRWLIPATLFAILAVLIKTPALHLGIVQFAAVLFGPRHYLKSPALWLSWLAILAGLALYATNAHQLYEQYGNTFGIGFGGDAKWPGLKDLLNPVNYYSLLRVSMDWGIGIFGFIGGILLLVRRKLSHLEWALLLGLAAHLVVSMRYSSSLWIASHYHIFGVFVGSWLFAHALNVYLPRGNVALTRVVTITLAIVLTLLGAKNVYARVHHPARDDGERFMALAAAAKKHFGPSATILVRAPAASRVEGWSGGRNNYEDPRLFYLTQSKGFVLAGDDDDPQKIESAVAHNARYYIHVGDFEYLPRTQAWLASDNHATLLEKNQHGAIYTLHAANQ